MRRTALLLTMLALTALGVLSVGGWWLRRAADLPMNHERIQPGMTLREIERLIGQRFTAHESCLRHEYYLLVEQPLAGQITCIDITTRPNRLNRRRGVLEAVTRDEETCLTVDVSRRSRFTWLNDQAWTRWLIGLPSDA